MAQQQYDWLVQLPDKPNALKTRLANVQAHLESVTSQVEAGKIIMGGPMLSARPANLEDGETRISGSVQVVKASTEEEVWQRIKADPYAKLGVWDLDKATVLLMKVMIMRPL